MQQRDCANVRFFAQIVLKAPEGLGSNGLGVREGKNR
jgi:hypothetical protein